MKKTLSLLLVLAMVLSSFSFAFAAEAEKTPGEILKDLGVLTGNAKGDLMLEDELSRQDMIVLLSRVLGQEDEAKAFKGEMSFTDVNDSFYKPYIAWAEANKLTNGVEEGKFGFGRAVTEQEVATLMLRALGYNDVEFKDVPAKAVELGLVAKDADLTVNAKRARMAEITLAALGTKMNGSDKTLAEHLELELPKPAKLEVVEVKADNLKEIKVVFNKAVDEESATDEANYSLKSGKIIKFVTLSEDQKIAIITLEGTLANNKMDAVSISNVKSEDEVLNEKNLEFTPVDNMLPEVESITSLGTKSVKVTFTEPVKDIKQNNFQLDGKTYFGKVTVSATERSVILTPYNTSALAVGDHTLYVTGVKDYAGFVSLNSIHEFTVIEDKEAPTITEATATLETVTLTFSEDVDPDTIAASKVYWKSGNAKITAESYKALGGNKYRYTFNKNNSLPTGSIVIYVEGVKDYSGNEIAKDTTAIVTPEIDQTRPEVKKVEAIDSKNIRVTFSKVLKLGTVNDIKNYTITDKDGKILSVQSANYFVDSKGITHKDIITITLYGKLSTGKNTITIKNIKDDTRLENTMLDYTGEIIVGDTTAPKIDSKLVNKAGRTVIVQFNEAMDPATLTDYTNYLVKVNGSLRPLTPAFAEISVLQDSKAVAINFVEAYNGMEVEFGTTNSTVKQVIQELHILGVKDVAGNLLENFVTSTNNIITLGSDVTVALKAYNANISGAHQAALVDGKTIKVRFNAGIVNYNSGAFVVTKGGNNILNSVSVDGTSTVTLNLTESLGTLVPNDLVVKVDISKLVTLAGEVSGSIQSANVLDLVEPVVKANNANTGYKNFQVTGENIKVDLSEPIKKVHSSLNESLIAKSFKVTRYYDGEVLVPGVDFTIDTIVDGAQSITIRLDDKATREVNTKYIVEVLDTNYIVDLSDAENELKGIGATETDKEVEFSAVERIVVTGPTTIEVPYNGVASKTVNYSAVVKNQNDVVIEKAVTFAFTDETGKVTFSNGVLTVTNLANAGSHTLTAKAEGIADKKITITLTKEPSRIAKVRIAGEQEISIPTDDTAVEKQYTATVEDQYGTHFTAPDNTVTWSLEKSVTGVSLDSNGKLNVAKEASAASFKIIATSLKDNTVKGEYTITLK